MIFVTSAAAQVSVCQCSVALLHLKTVKKNIEDKLSDKLHDELTKSINKKLVRIDEIKYVAYLIFSIYLKFLLNLFRL